MERYEREELKRRVKDSGLSPKQLVTAAKKAARAGRYMDGNGFQRKSWKDSVKQIRRAERWINEILNRGATVPEAWWDILNTFAVAMENVRFSRVRGESAFAALTALFDLAPDVEM